MFPGHLWRVVLDFMLTYFVAQAPLGGVSGDSLQAEQISHERTMLADSYANEKLWYWQGRLHLDYWKVSLTVVRLSELKPNTLGNIRWDLDQKTATIRVLDPADYSMSFTKILDDIEFTVVHELIHLQRDLALNHDSHSEANRWKEEHAVNHETEILLKVDRGR